ncbi:MAG TPA: hypothetical protein VF079_03815 [Sphingomicrobium sp.]
MPTFKITIVNEHLNCSNDYEGADEAAACHNAISGALAIATDEVMKGEPFFGAEVRVDRGENPVARFIVAIGMSPLKLTAATK